MNYEKITLKNGSTLIVVKMPESLSATFMIFSRSGPKFDPKNKPGLSHFTEHLLFRGTKRYQSNEILSRTLENYGAMAEGFSYQETNTYTAKIPKENISVAIDILMDQLQNSALRPKDIETEKEVVTEELNMVKSSPSEYISELWAENIWKNNGLGRVYAGNLKSIKSFTKKDVIKFMRENYFPKGITYVVAGDMKAKDIENLINKNLLIKNWLKVRKEKVTKIIRNNPINIQYSDVESIAVDYGFLTVCRQSSDSHVLELLEYFLGRGLGSRFNQTIAQKGLTYYVMTRTQHLSDTGYFLINFTSQRKNLNKTLEVINQQLTDIKNGGFSENELNRAKSYYIGQLLINNETTDSLASWFGYQSVDKNEKILTIKEKQNIIKSITKRELIDVANKYFREDNWYLSAIGPIKEEDIKIRF